MNRRDFIKAMLGTGALLTAGCSLTAENKTASVANVSVGDKANDLPVEFFQQIITDDICKRRRIVWQTATKLENPVAEYRDDETQDARQIPVEDASFSDDGKTLHRYSVTLENGGKDFQYRLVCGDSASDWAKQQTRPDNDIRAIIFPDSQSADYNVWANVAKAAARDNAQVDFFVNMGDIVDNGEATEQWQAWFAGLPKELAAVPFAPIMGNHETYDRNWQVRLPSAYLGYFPVPDNSSNAFARYYYSFDCKEAHFATLNTQWLETNDFKPGLMDEQKKWLREDMAHHAKKWNIALLHKDVLQYRINGRPERQEGFSDVGEEFMPLFTELGFDAVLTAHLHTLRDRGHIENLAKNGRKGPLYILTGVAGDVRYPGLWTDHAFDEYVAPQPETDNFLTLNITDDVLTVAAFLPNGEKLFRREVRKEPQ